MESAAWTAIGLLGTSLGLTLGAYFRLNAKIEGQGRDLREAIDAQGRHLGARVDAQGGDIGARIDAQTARIDALNARMDTHLERHAG